MEKSEGDKSGSILEKYQGMKWKMMIFSWVVLGFIVEDSLTPMNANKEPHEESLQRDRQRIICVKINLTFILLAPSSHHDDHCIKN